jgi:hypothetical protein
MKALSLFISFLLILIIPRLSIAQSENKDVSIKVSGSGNTLEEAKQAALRSATEQAFGAFISTKTELLNDKVVSDQMASVSNGNIKSYEVLNQDKLPDGRWGVTLNTTVSVDKLTSFVEAKGIAIEIKGGVFALNIKQQLLNEQGEIKAVAEMIGLLHEPMQISFDYLINSGDPKSLDAESKNWEIPLMVTAVSNKNIDFCAEYFMKTLAAISLSSAEVKSYEALNKQVYYVEVNHAGKLNVYYLRKKYSINAIRSLKYNWSFYTSLFVVQSGLDDIYGNDESWKNKGPYIQKFPDEDGHSISIFFPNSGQKVCRFSRNDKRSLSQIESMSGFFVKPRGVVSHFKYGGYVISEKDGQGLVISLFDLGELNWTDARGACENLDLNGYRDWRLPSNDEATIIIKSRYKQYVGAPFSDHYWSASELVVKDDYGRFIHLFDPKNSRDGGGSEYSRQPVRAVRTFRSL